MDNEQSNLEDHHHEAILEKPRRWVPGFGFAGGAACFLYLMTILYPMYENSKTIAVDGTVVSIIEKVTTGSGTNTGAGRSVTKEYWHEFRFKDQAGVEHISRSVGWFGLNSSHSVGSIVSIGYYPGDFSKVRDYSWFKIWKFQLLILFVALMFFGIKFLTVEQPTDTNRSSIDIS